MYNWWKRTQSRGGAPARQYTMPTNEIKVKNESGADRAAGEILEIGDKLIDTLTRFHPWCSGDTPTIRPYHIGVLPVPLPSEKLGVLQVDGICLAKIDIDATWGQYHPRAYPLKDTYVLQSGFAGPIERLWPPIGTAHPEGTGEQMCLVRLNTQNRATYHAVTPAGGIGPAVYGAASVTPTFEDCSLWVWDSDASDYVPHPNDVKISICNQLPEGINGGYFIKASEDQDWIITVDVEACTDAF